MICDFVYGPAGNRTRISSLQTTCSTIGLQALSSLNPTTNGFAVVVHERYL